MFTGVVAGLGTVKGIQRSSQAGVLTIAATRVLSDGVVGDSIAMDGACLTMVLSPRLSPHQAGDNLGA